MKCATYINLLEMNADGISVIENVENEGKGSVSSVDDVWAYVLTFVSTFFIRGLSSSLAFFLGGCSRRRHDDDAPATY